MDIKRQTLKDNLMASNNSSIDERVDRYLDIGHHWIIGNHHFAAASSSVSICARRSFYCRGDDEP